jgi:competence protein ComEC
LWEIVVVSLSAQLGIFAISVHYFHFFPSYFLLTNLLVFPLSFLILSSGLLFVAIFWIPILSNVVGFVLYYLVWLMNFLIEIIRNFPFSGVSGIYAPWSTVIIIYLLIFSMFYWLVLRKARFILISTISVFLLISIYTYRQFENLNQKEILVYNINNHTAIDFIVGKEHLLLTDSGSIGETGMIDFHLANFYIARGMDKRLDSLSGEFDNRELGLIYRQGIALFNNYKLLILDDKSNFYTGNAVKPSLDAVIVTGRKKVELEELMRSFSVEFIIIDGSVPSWKRKQMKVDAGRLNIRVYDTNERGYFTQKL